ncbi:hypothetical protein L228DRAFT_243475 [Xylona heveae TC161]|uniref:C2H2-type domain-containing protein n=1 Tax=Xylona heveae (strain CBS 132557 / TC161) TaxID=1328760 RepID=A0A165K2Z5_XYLHT|nr:hypothetical protein L228DRAFT_243475 [Xylona heveae TC161]KZF26927.1 hypothetical protein L228DRAFT_243475 [Xylona heveae TC161]
MIILFWRFDLLSSIGQHLLVLTKVLSRHTAREQAPAKPASGAENGNAAFPPPKADKPRPHVCGTCSRSFARLEHLKRHERSHTKEKPFECPECTRCFARRDLLLRHQQKLHMTATAASRPRNGRRESSNTVAGVGSGRVRKNSVATSNVASAGVHNASAARPRANTISHIDNSTLGMVAAANASTARSRDMGVNHSHHPSLDHLPTGFSFHAGLPSAPAHLQGLSKLDTHGLNIDMSGGLRTAPPFGGPGSEFDFDNLFGPGSTINPAQLHFNDSPQSMGMNELPAGFPIRPPMLEEDENLDWMKGFEHSMSFTNANDPPVDGSSPSVLSTASQSGISEIMLDGSNNPAHRASALWQNSMIPNARMGSFFMDLPPSAFSEMAPPGTVSPKTLQAQNGMNDPYLSPPALQALSPPMASADHSHFFHPATFNSDCTSTSSVSVSGTTHKSSVTSVSSDCVTEATRQALLAGLSLSHDLHHGPRKYSSSIGNSPMSPGFVPSPAAANISLPSTSDLQRYITAYVQYFHPHLPFLHLPSLNFDSPAFANNVDDGHAHSLFGHSGVAGGGGCLILAMAAIGALYEYDAGPSKSLFEAAKKMIHIYLEERHKSGLSAAMGGKAGPDLASEQTPLWLIQAMLLNVIYGHNCGDKTAADIASTHCVALVRLARAAELARPLPPMPSTRHHATYPFSGPLAGEDTDMHDASGNSDYWNLGFHLDGHDEQAEWQQWRVAEERKRTLYAIFVFSSLLVSTYNHQPALTNSEVQLDLPCEEELWNAETAQAWQAKGGASIVEQKAVPFATALSTLLTANQRRQSQQAQPQPFHGQFGPGYQMEDILQSDLKPSTFGCLVLISALHNYIWETRQRHLGRQWTPQEVEAMHAHLEPALKAWQAAWASNPNHSLDRPNPFGLGPLSADSIPLLDLAYVSLFVNLGPSKECFWQRNWDGMAEELARGAQIVYSMEHSPSSSGNSPSDASELVSSNGTLGSPHTTVSSPDRNPAAATAAAHQHRRSVSMLGPDHHDHSGQSTKRERHLRKAAFYAADSLSMSDKLGISFNDLTSRELPIQSIMCAFDCAQVLAEWVATVQERVGRYLGVLGRDEIDYTQVPGIMLLEDEDCKLLDKIKEVLNGAEIRLSCEHGGMDGMAARAAMIGLSSNDQCGFGAKILLVTAHMLEKGPVWPVTRQMVNALQTQAGHMKARVEASVAPRE